MKQLCNVHHFNYEVSKGCPFCQQEKWERIMKKAFVPKTEKVQENKPITEIDLDKLCEKFNVKFK